MQTSLFPSQVRKLVVLSAALLLTGCGTILPSESEHRRLNIPTISEHSTDSRTESQVRAYLQQNNPLAAAKAYESTAAQSPDPLQRELYQIKTVELLFDYNYPDLARQKMAQLPRGSSNSNLLARRQILEARAAITLNNPDRALSMLPNANDINDQGIQIQTLRVKAQALEMKGDTLNALKTRMHIDRNLSSNARQHNHKAIWRILSTQNESQIRGLRGQISNKDTNGWLDLATLFKNQHQYGAGFNEQLHVWQLRHKDHPANLSFIWEMRNQKQATYVDSSHIAVMLPLQGKLSQAGQAIRDGILAASYSSDNNSTVNFYDIGDDFSDIVQVYQQAVQNGATAVIGPLSKNKANSLVNHYSGQSLPAPLLTLNYLQDGQTPNAVFQIGLLPEDEARGAAEYAYEKGYRKALVLTPNDTLGSRIYAAFTEHYNELGGKVVGSAKIDSKSNDFSNPIKSVLLINDAKTRHKRIQNILGTDVKFQAQRRTDADFVFLPSSARAARLIKPQLKFYDAAGLPVLSTSRVFEGRDLQRLNRDLDGIRFNDSPWVQQGNKFASQTNIQVSALPQSQPLFGRLQALGADAYTVLQNLTMLQKNPTSAIQGLSGKLSLPPSNRIKREPNWAIFRNGLPETLE